MNRLLLLKFLIIIGISGYGQSNQAGNEWYADPVLWIGGSIFLIILFIYILYKMLANKGRAKKDIIETKDENRARPVNPNDISFDEIERQRNLK